MQIVILCNDLQKEELTGNGILNTESIVWITNVVSFEEHRSADVFIDLLFANSSERIGLLTGLLPKLVIINSVDDTLAEINSSFVRINGWSTFLSSNLIEAASLNEPLKTKAEETFAVFGKGIEWMPDIAGLYYTAGN